MVLICNMRSSGKYNEKDGKKVNLPYIVDQNHQRSVIVVFFSRNFKGIWSMVITMGRYLSKNKKFKNEKLLKNYNLGS